MTDLGPIPGRYNLGTAVSLFPSVITPKFKLHLAKKGLQGRVNSSFNNCSLSLNCQLFLTKGITFVNKVYMLFPMRTSDNDFLYDRPDFYLGRFLEMFADKVYQLDFKLDIDGKNKTLLQDFLNFIIKLYFTQLSQEISSENTLGSLGCYSAAYGLITHGLYQNFIEIVKYSQMDYLSNNDLLEFKLKYLNISLNSKPFIPVEPVFLKEKIGIIPFCEMTRKPRQNTPQTRSFDCILFDLIMTARGICYSFNALTNNEIFKKSKETETWRKILNLKEKSALVNPASSDGLYFILNSFNANPIDDPNAKTKASGNFILSITNEFNPFNIYKQNFVIEPGYSYIYRIIANQVVTTERFDKLDKQDRNCLLASENMDSNLTNHYSKSGCLYECILKKAMKKWQCVPWNVPSILPDSFEYCPINENSILFIEKMEQFNTTDCNCPSDCSGTYFSVFESKTPFKNPGYYCSNIRKYLKKGNEYPNNVLCNLCNKMIQNFKIKFLYDHVVDDELDPSISPELFCEKLFIENFALIHVKMATNYITRFNNFINHCLSHMQQKFEPFFC